MMHKWSRPNARTPVLMRQRTWCVQASVRRGPLSVQKTGMLLPWHFFVHSIAVTPINTGPFSVYSSVHCDDSCTHSCVQGVYARVYSVFPANTRRKGVCAWRPVP
jgi:hypothetical protein